MKINHSNFFHLLSLRNQQHHISQHRIVITIKYIFAHRFN